MDAFLVRSSALTPAPGVPRLVPPDLYGESTMILPTTLVPMHVTAMIAVAVGGDVSVGTSKRAGVGGM
jgi:hypothetical protein